MKVIWKVLAVVALAAYPLLVFAGISSFGARPMALVLLALLGLRFFLPGLPSRAAPAFIVLVALVVVAPTLWFDRADYLRFYPVLMNIAMFGLFASSLLAGQTIIEKIARVSDPALSAAGVRYTRHVTQVWCVFFILNASIAFYTAIACRFATWALYNGLVAYGLMGLLFAAEYGVRRIFRRNERLAQTESP
ncbi:MAG TPA: hypothetical protein PLF22_04550 [Pseudomonadales bacterium]|nr:hypothetical protein [Pseudomonadales bacterium]